MDRKGIASCAKNLCDFAKFREEKRGNQVHLTEDKRKALSILSRFLSDSKALMELEEQSVHNTGFTVVELLTVISIITIVSVISIPLFISWIPDYRLKSAALDLFSNFQVARIRAMQSRSEYGILFNVSAGSYQLICGGTNKRLETDGSVGDDIIE